MTHVTRILSAPKLLTELRHGSNSFDGKLPSKILNLDWLKKLYLLHNPGISGHTPSNTNKMTDLMDLELSLTSLHGNISSVFGLPKDLFYLGIYETHIHGPIPTKVDSKNNIKYLSIKPFLRNIQFYDFTVNSTVVASFKRIVLLILKGLNKYLSS